jgi:dTDP-4-amino-4,6-dideoxygalactose transaminase
LTVKNTGGVLTVYELTYWKHLVNVNQIYLRLHYAHPISKMINVTRPFLPTQSEYEEKLTGIWNRNWLTNNGPLVNELELQLKQFLDIDHLLYVTNGTIALQMAIEALDLQGEVITTPFSYIATTSSIIWQGCEPVFADIDPESLNIDPEQIERVITPHTTGILATHTYGNACRIEEIEAIALKHGLKVIYDAAHCFGSVYKGKSLLSYGDISTTSFHATKLFHTIEGGAVFTKSAALIRRMAFMRNFGHNGPTDFEEVGINGKNSEFHAAMGLTNLRHVPSIIEKRSRVFDRYQFWMQHIIGRTISITPGCTFNFAYFPLIFESEKALLKAQHMLEAHWIYPRRYFYPALNSLKFTPNSSMPVCDELCRRVLCLPMYDSLGIEEVDFICRIILRAQNNEF